MKKLVVIFAMFGLMFNVIGCKAKKAQDETEIVENADVEKIEAEDAQFAGLETTVDTGPVDESLQAALGEAPETDVTPAGALPEDGVATTDVVNTDIAAAPTLDEATLGSEVVANTDTVSTDLAETPVIETPAEAPPVEVAQNEPAVDSSLVPDTTMTGAVSEINEASNLTESPLVESTVAETPVVAEVKEASVKPAASSNTLKKISETVPYKYGEGFVNTVYIARPKEKLADISRSIFGMDKSKELKSINTFLQSRGPKGGDKIYYVSPHRASDSSRTISFYEDNGMIASTYVAEKGENLNAISKKLLGYDNAWKEIWTTNELASKTKLAAGESIRYWKAAEQIQTTPTLAQNEGPAKIVDSPNQMPEQMPPAQEVAMNTPPPQAQEIPPPADMNQPVAQQQELPPPPPPQELAAAPVAPAEPPVAQHNMEEEPTGEEGAMSSDTTMMIGVLAVLVAALALVLVRRNKKKKEADLASIEQNHVGT
jgi:hypothetical protein